MFDHPRKKRRKIYYPVGLISLIGLPLICLWYLNKQNAFQEFKMISVVVQPRIFCGPYVPSKPKKYYETKLSANTKANEIALREIQQEITKHVRAGDTVPELHVHFTDNTPFQAFIQVLDIQTGKKSIKFDPFYNDVRVISSDAVVNNDLQEYGESAPVIRCGFMEKTDPNILEQKQREKEISYITQTARQFAIPIGLFVCMIVLAIRRQRRYFAP